MRQAKPMEVANPFAAVFRRAGIRRNKDKQVDKAENMGLRRLGQCEA